jgi:hypothetical protein
MRDRGLRRIDFRISLASSCALLCLASSGCTHPGNGGDDGPGVDVACTPPAPAAALTNDQRKAFLHYYSPIILKQASEPPDVLGRNLIGRDWITNFDFDADGGQLFNNKRHWELGLAGFVLQGANPGWEIRPTLYSHIIEFTANGTKSAVLVYHVYHAMQIDSIHDWERVEIRLEDVVGDPGSGESIAFVVITEHSWHRARPAAEVSFQHTPQGEHALIWQAPWGVTLQAGNSVESALPMTAQLNFVEESWVDLDKMFLEDGWATLTVNDLPIGRNFHYVFVDAADSAATSYWGAGTISSSNAQQMAAGVRSVDAVSMSEVKPIRYELQDTADVFPSHLDSGGTPSAWRRFLAWLCPCNAGCEGHGNPNWTCPRVTILLDDPIADESGVPQVQAGERDFLAGSIDDANPCEDRKGYPRKHWFWGAYLFNKEGNFLSEAYEDGTPNGTRGLANGRIDSHGSYWYQHDYFAHTGAEVSGAGSDAEQGHWLCQGWHLEASGGFDGRWTQLFPD